MKKLLFILTIFTISLFANNFSNYPVKNIIKIQIKNLNLMLPKNINNKLNLELYKVEEKNKDIIYIYKFTKKNTILNNILNNELYKKEIKKEFQKNIFDMLKNDQFTNLLKKNGYNILNKFYFKNQIIFQIKY